MRRHAIGKTHITGEAGRGRGKSRQEAFGYFEAGRNFGLFPGDSKGSIDRMTEYEKIYRFDNLYRAYKLTARGKRGKAEVVNFELDLAGNLWKLHDELKERTYRPPVYRKFMIYDPKEREIQALPFRDRVVQNSLCNNVLREWFENRLIYDCAACRKDKGTHFGIDRLSHFMRDFYRQKGTSGYFLKCDIRKYFASIDHEVLKYLLRKFPDEEVKTFLYMIIDSFNADTGKGLPMGNQSSQWFALYYLDRIDRLVKEKYRIKYYSRYMDDLVLIHEDKERLKDCLGEMREVAEEELKLKFNQKTQMFPISEGVDYVGWHFYLTETGKVIRKLRRSNKRRFKRRLKKFQREYSEGVKSIEEIKRSLVSYNGHMRHGHTWRLREKVYGDFLLTRGEEQAGERI